MKENKLRAWDIFNNTMVYSSEEYAVFILEKGEWKIKYVREKNLVKDGIEIDAPVWIESDEVEVMMFTGLTDKNGKDIYEGDILSGVADEPCLVEWNTHYASFVLNKKGWMFSHWFGESCDPGNTEIIGNIYNNHELLKQ